EARERRRLGEHDVGARLVGHPHRLLPERGGGDRDRGDLALRAGVPTPEAGLEAVERFLGVHVADDGQAQRRRAEALALVAFQVLARERLRARDPLAARAAVERVLRRIDAPQRRLLRPRGRLVLLLPDRSDEPLLLLLELFLREGRLAEDLGEEVEEDL